MSGMGKDLRKKHFLGIQLIELERKVFQWLPFTECQTLC